MDDSYLGIWQASASGSLTARVAACAVKEGESEPEQWAQEHRWTWASAPGWGAAFDSASAAGDLDPGASPNVITDGMILTEVQRIRGNSQ